MERKALRVLVISPETAVETLLRRRLSSADFEVLRLAPGGALVEGVRRVRPDIAVIDRADSRREAVPMEVALLRDARPEVRVIAVSAGAGTGAEDGTLVELGLFFFLQASPPLRLPDLVLAAARSLGNRGLKTGG
jgi:DNA-binding response OmpR family regulator